MFVIKEIVTQSGSSCNFCQKGELKENRVGLNFPYEEIIRFSRSKDDGISPAICRECLDELYEKAKKEFADLKNETQ